MVRVRHTYSSIGNIVGGIIMLVVGIGVLIGAIFYTNSLNSKLAKWPRVTATVVDYAISYDTDHDIMYSEVLEYTVNGQTVTVKSRTSSNIPPSLNVRKEIAYNPDVPTDFVYAEGVDKSLPQIIMFAVGGIFTAVGALFLVSIIVKKVKAKRKPAVSGTSEMRGSEIPGTVYDMYGNGDVFSDNKIDDRDDEPYEKLHYGDE